MYCTLANLSKHDLWLAGTYFLACDWLIHIPWPVIGSPARYRRASLRNCTGEEQAAGSGASHPATSRPEPGDRAPVAGDSLATSKLNLVFEEVKTTDEDMTEDRVA